MLDFMRKKHRLLQIGSVASAIVNILLNMIFIPRLGIIAAGYTTVFTYFLLFIFHYNIAKKITNKRSDTKKICIIIIFVSIFS